jgi:hypothetical protein
MIPPSRSADFQSAVSLSCTQQRVRKFGALRISGSLADCKSAILIEPRRRRTNTNSVESVVPLNSNSATNKSLR